MRRRSDPPHCRLNRTGAGTADLYGDYLRCQPHERGNQARLRDRACPGVAIRTREGGCKLSISDKEIKSIS